MSEVKQLITDNLDIWSSAIKAKSVAGRGTSKKNIDLHGIKKLRELILELAVRGLLVEQDTNDEPVSKLLKKIADEKSKLLEEGKIKKQKKSLEIDDSEKPFDVPEGWVWVRLGELGNIFNGNSISKTVKEAKYTDVEGGLPFIATKDVGYGWQELEYENGISIPADEPNFKMAHKGSVFICAEGGSAGKKCGITNRNIFFGNKLFALELYGDCERDYLLSNYLSPSFYSQFSAKMTGIIGGISLEKLKQLLIPLPSVSEQHRIVAKVDELMALCDQLEQQTESSISAHQTLVKTLLGALTSSSERDGFNQAWARIAEHFDTLFTTEWSIDQLKQTILQLAVMGKLSISENTDTPIIEIMEEIRKEKQKMGMNKKEEEIFYTEYDEAKRNIVKNRIHLRARFFCDFITKGTTPSKQELLPDEEVPFLKVYNIVNNQLDFNYKPIFISKHVHQTKLKRSVVYPNDVIMNIVGPPLGKVAIITSDYPEWNMNQALAVFRPLCGIYNQYIYYMLSSEPVLKSVLKEVKGTAGQDNLSLEQCRNLIFPIPSIQEQHRVVAIVTKLLTVCDTLKSNLNQTQTTQLQLADAMTERALA